METKEKKGKLSVIGVLMSSRLLLYSIAELLQPEDISQLIKAISNTHQHNDHLVGVLEGFLFVREHLWKSNRDVYFDIYEEPRFTTIEKCIIAKQVENNPIFRQLQEARNHLKQVLPLHLEAIEPLEIIADDPPIHIPKLIRENVGVGCSSLFQNFLLSSRSQFHMDRELQWLVDYHEKRQNIYIENFAIFFHSQQYFSNISCENLPTYEQKFSKSVLEKICTVRYQPHMLSYKNFKEYLIEDNELHNYIVYLFTLADTIVISSMEYVNGIDEPYHKLLEFCTRYEMFRNFFIAVQEELAPVFNVYEQVCENFFVGMDIRKFCFWKSALQKWVQHMSVFHSTCIQTIVRENIKLVHENIVSIIEYVPESPNDEKKLNLQEHRSINYLKNLDVGQLFPLEKPIVEEVYELVSEEFPFCNKSFSDYMMDISIDENNVFWCGHENQKVGIFFKDFENSILLANEFYYQQIIQHCEKDLFRKIVQENIQFICHDEMYKEKTLVKIIELSNHCLNKLGLAMIHFPILDRYKEMCEEIERINLKLGIPLEILETSESNCEQIGTEEYEDHTVLMKSFVINGTLDTNHTSKEEPEFEDYMEEEKELHFIEGDESDSFMNDESKQVLFGNTDEDPFEPPSSSAFPYWVL